MKARLCKCNNCDTVMIDQNPKTDTPELEVPDNATDMQFIDEEGGGYWGCPVCNYDGYLMDITEQSQLPSTPVDEVKDKEWEKEDNEMRRAYQIADQQDWEAQTGSYAPVKDKHTKRFGQKTLAEKYLEWVNDWLTVDAMADNYGMTKEQMLAIIERGKIEHNQNCNSAKDKHTALISQAPAMREALISCYRCLTMDSDMEEDFAPEIKEIVTILDKIGW